MFLASAGSWQAKEQKVGREAVGGPTVRCVWRGGTSEWSLPKALWSHMLRSMQVFLQAHCTDEQALRMQAHGELCGGQERKALVSGMSVSEVHQIWNENRG